MKRKLAFGDVSPNLEGKVVLVTGGTGSFGTAMVRRLLAEASPRKVIVFSRDEQKHYQMQQTLDDGRLRYFVGDVRDRDRLRRAFEGVDVVFHSAAMKHVPLAEYNPIEAIRTNISGAENVIDAALERGVERVVALSTDKAVNPVNLYGATKLCMEKLFVAANSYRGASRGTSFAVVRYGNVVGSKGSVVPLFLAQREKGEITITDPRMTRFWITMDQALDLCLHAAAVGKGGEVFVPQIPATDLATLVEALAPDCRRRIVGIRPGEKLHEALITADEARQVVDTGKVYVIEPSFPWWGGSHHEGRRVPEDFCYTSANATHRPGVEELRGMLRSLGFLPPQSAA
ncbi:UDP-N-acetylglucosamine 4,6-dehydratase (inverting) [Polyangium sp. 15x6]|uniref:UDP-N-acetylglucosamine 4,6-dehydratase (inverting) n=1 Tax=Polyangium sp. 15x6 TaxID=3042687 RepID=UPI00249B5E0F|nr:UDP-N-acetylglucosamine 4,6-dehydratase (inverting) [Polyangium sp. 15x6]MDI3286257.1 UDP-N-acetylglucosamine 4,6-dehydratase (inverting) [Polyangium sp. 15x6]